MRKSGRHFFGNFGPFWWIFGPFWIILDHSRAILGHLGSYLGHFGSFFGHFWAILWHLKRLSQKKEMFRSVFKRLGKGFCKRWIGFLFLIKRQQAIAKSWIRWTIVISEKKSLFVKGNAGNHTKHTFQNLVPNAKWWEQCPALVVLWTFHKRWGLGR